MRIDGELPRWENKSYTYLQWRNWRVQMPYHTVITPYHSNEIHFWETLTFTAYAADIASHPQRKLLDYWSKKSDQASYITMCSLEEVQTKLHWDCAMTQRPNKVCGSVQGHGCRFCGTSVIKISAKSLDCTVHCTIHLELVQSLCTNSFILPLQRFSTCSSSVLLTYSENGTNFVGANNECPAIIGLGWNNILHY